MSRSRFVPQPKAIVLQAFPARRPAKLLPVVVLTEAGASTGCVCVGSPEACAAFWEEREPCGCSCHREPASDGGMLRALAPRVA